MDRDLGASKEVSDRLRDGSPLAVSSRRRAFEQVLAVANQGEGHAVLITGEPGAGKTWLTHQIARFLPPSWMSTYVDLTGAMTALDFLHLLGHSLGIPLSSGLGAARARLQSILHDDDIDGRRWVLIIDDAHRGSPAVWEELEAVVNESSRGAGFGAIVVLGDTEFVRRIAARGLRGFASTFWLHLHLPPLDVDEARQLLTFGGHSEAGDDRTVEELHRDSLGNAAGLLRLARARGRFISPPPMGKTAAQPVSGARSQAEGRLTISPAAGGSEQLAAQMPESPAPSRVASVEKIRPGSAPLVPAKPPIRLEEGLVEVGWDGDLETEYSEPANATASLTIGHQVAGSGFDEELIDDPYAALQAWSEWTGGQETSGSTGIAIEGAAARRAAEPVAETAPTPAPEPAGSPEATPAAPPPGVRVEAQHEFAPYSQLFTRLRPSKQP